MSVFFEGNAFIDGGQVQNTLVTSSSVSNCVITTSSLDMNLATITNVLNPINAQDAATKQYVDNLGVVITTVSLAGTSTTQISSAQVGSYVVKVENIISNGPCAVFNVCKNAAGLAAHITRITSSPGLSSPDVSLRITWPPNTGILLRKTGTSFDGAYRVKIM